MSIANWKSFNEAKGSQGYIETMRELCNMFHLDDVIDTLGDYYTEIEDDLNLTLDKGDNSEYFLYDRFGTIITLYTGKNMSLKKLMDCEGNEFELHTTEILNKYSNGFTHEMGDGRQFSDKIYSKLINHIKSGSKDYGISIRTEFQDNGKLKSTLYELSKEVGEDTLVSYNSFGKIIVDRGSEEDKKQDDFFKKLKASNETLKKLIQILNLIKRNLNCEWNIDIHSQDHSPYDGRNRYDKLDLSNFKVVISVDIIYKPNMQSDWEAKIPDINKRDDLINFIKKLSGKKATELIEILSN